MSDWQKAKLPPHLAAKIRDAVNPIEDPPVPEPTEEELGARHLRNCGFPEKSVRWIESNGLAALRARPAGQALESFMRSEQLVAVLEGGVGAGKTTLSALAFLHGKRRRPCGYDYDTGETRYEDEYDASTCFFYDGDDFRQVHPEWSDWLPTLRRLETAPILVIDDLATTEKDSAKVMELVQGVLKKRDARCLKTIISTNATTDELTERYGKRVASRFAQEALTISCGEQDLRARSQAA